MLAPAEINSKRLKRMLVKAVDNEQQAVIDLTETDDFGVLG